MRGYMFRNRLGALIFVAGILFAVFRMVGTEESAGELVTAANKLQDQRASLAAGNGRAAHQQNGSPGTADESDWGDGGFGQEK